MTSTRAKVEFIPWVALVLVMQAACAEQSSSPSAVAGVLDLRSWSFEADGAVQLTGDWGFCWDALLDPGDPSPEPGTCGTARVPGLWTEVNAAPGRGTATYRLRILLPPERPPLSLRVGAPMTSHRLFINGRSVAGTGRVTRTPEGHLSQLRNRIHVLPDAGDEIRLLIQVANFDFRSGGLRRRWILGSHEEVRSWSAAFTLRDTTLATVNMLVGLFFLGFFVNRPKERAFLYFGLGGVALGLRAVPSSYSDLAQLVAPDMMLPMVLRLEYFANNFIVFAGISYFACKLPDDMPSRIVRFIQAGSITGMLGALLLPLSLAQIPLRLSWVLGAFVLVTAFFALVRAARRGEPNVRITLAAVPFLLAVVLWDSFRAEGGIVNSAALPDAMLLMALTETASLFPISILALVLTEAVVLMRAFSRSYDTIERLSEELVVSNEDLRETNRAVVRFVPVDFLRLLKKESIRDVARGDCLETEMNIMFCDIRSFTPLVESMTPEEAFRFVNSFTEWMEPPIHTHGGFINQYLGDCIMALFPNGNDTAVRAGIDMLAALEGFNRAERERQGSHESTRVGIGINAGPLMIGTIGGPERLEHGVIGDAVNTASRVESLTKQYHTNLLISGTTYDGLSDPSAYDIRQLDRVVLKGRSEPIRIYEVLDALSPEARSSRLATRALFTEARLAYAARSFDEAERLFRACFASDPEDLASKLYITRCERRAVEGTPPDWHGEALMMEK